MSRMPIEPLHLSLALEGGLNRLGCESPLRWLADLVYTMLNTHPGLLILSRIASGPRNYSSFPEDLQRAPWCNRQVYLLAQCWPQHLTCP